MDGRGEREMVGGKEGGRKGERENGEGRWREGGRMGGMTESGKGVEW